MLNDSIDSNIFTAKPLLDTALMNFAPNSSNCGYEILSAIIMVISNYSIALM
jgi:hypothetical protein